MKLSAYTAPLASIYKKKFTRICCNNFSAYPNQRRWLLAHTDTNIDHRRVPNLMAFFARKGEPLPVSERSEDYSPGDLVTWDLGGNVPHIGIVVDRKSARTGRYLIFHNIGAAHRWKMSCSTGGPRAITATSGRLADGQLCRFSRPHSACHWIHPDRHVQFL